jgi:hypothetical protein
MNDLLLTVGMLRGLVEQLTGEEGAAGCGNREHHNPHERDGE